tara:strand:+ start:1320 stop:1619 length:300 start_codon:yes stop_codon:yes gene_type:complete
MHPEDQPVQANRGAFFGRGEEIGVSPNQAYKPSRSECLRQHEVRIRFLTLGCIIEVGCKSIPFATVREGMEALNEYVAKPYEMSEIWNKKFEEEDLYTK